MMFIYMHVSLALSKYIYLDGTERILDVISLVL